MSSAECCFGAAFKDFVLVAADKSQIFSIIVQKTDEDKVSVIDDDKLLACVGPTGDRENFTGYVGKNLALYKFRNGMKLSTRAAGNFIRSELATALRKGPYQVNMLLGGCDEGVGPELYWFDYLAAMHKVKYAAHGYAANFCLSLLDKHYREDMSVDEAMDLMDMCFAQIRNRLVVSPPNFLVKIVDKDGCRLLAHRDERTVVH